MSDETVPGDDEIRHDWDDRSEHEEAQDEVLRRLREDGVLD